MSEHIFPQLLTDRLLLRRIKKSDHPQILHLRSDKDINRFIKKEPLKNLREVEKLLERTNKSMLAQQSIEWGITLREKRNVIGSICLWNYSADRRRAEVGYLLKNAYHGKGIMSEALRAVLDYGFSVLGFEEIEAFTHRENVRSLNMLERHQFVVNNERKDEFNADNVVLSVTRERFSLNLNEK